MLAHNQAGLLNASRLAAGLSVSPPTVTAYVDLLVDLLLVRRLPPFHANVGKRLVKSPKVYVRDSGIVHTLLGIEDLNGLAGHPVVGASWEGHVIETLLSLAPARSSASFYRTAAGAEIDLLLTFPGGRSWAIEIKRSLAPRVDKGFQHACEDVDPARRLVVYPGSERFRLSRDVEVVPLATLGQELLDLSGAAGPAG